MIVLPGGATLQAYTHTNSPLIQICIHPPPPPSHAFDALHPPVWQDGSESSAHWLQDWMAACLDWVTPSPLPSPVASRVFSCCFHVSMCLCAEVFFILSPHCAPPEHSLGVDSFFSPSPPSSCYAVLFPKLALSMAAIAALVL